MLSVVDIVSSTSIIGNGRQANPPLSDSWLLVRHPQVMSRLRQEIAAVMKDFETPTRELIRRMPFLSCVIKESTLFPAISPQLPHSHEKP
jgi:hypothetical protein